MQISLQDLKKHTTHPLKTTFDNYSRAQIAKNLEISTGHLINILYGHLQPSKSLEDKIQDLAKAIQEAERAEVA